MNVLGIVYSYCFEKFGYFTLREDGSMLYWSNKTAPDMVSEHEANLKQKYPNMLIVKAHKHDAKSKLCLEKYQRQLGSNPTELLDLWTWNTF